MPLEAISGAAMIAVTSTVVFLLVAKTWHAAARAVATTPSFGDRLMRESAQRFRDELERLSNSQSAYLGAALVFVMLFVAAWFLDAGALFAGYPTWQLYLQLVVLLVAGVYAAFQLLRTILRRRQVRFVRDATMAIGHQLQQLPAGFARLYHDVPTAAGVVDHVLIGATGIYAVNVLALRSGKQAHARLIDNEMQFSDGKPDLSIVDVVAKTKRLEKEFRQLVGHAVRVRSVVALPGWEIGDQLNKDHLLVNERTILMLSGWKDNSDYLMNEDVELLRQDLVERCSAG